MYCKNNPVNAIDPDGRGGLKVLLKSAYKIGKSVAKNGISSLGKGAAYATAFKDVVDYAKTVFDSKASTGDRIMAGVSLLSEVISPVSFKEAKTKSVQQKTKDCSHDNPHWEAGRLNMNKETGEVRMNRYGRYRLENSKSKEEYE